ncbi:MAG TPA: MOSC N-terminal beta barrel domain-containing protein [Solirubrobacteraceae bacterium]|nr:MOSC N-terminal beta barrel domain-containing protein [Solirubrobacteraceae bacterium]
MPEVRSLTLAPVKGLRVTETEALDLGPRGPAGDRAFLVVDPDNALLLTTRTPALLQVAARWDGDRLALAFPDGSEVAAVPEPGAPAATANYEGRRISGRLVEGDLAAALSAHLGRPVRLLHRRPDDRGADDAPVTLMSQASLEALGVPDARRFRMTITIDGVGAWEEHGWGGRELAAGDAVLRVTAPVPRCVVTTRDPDSGRHDAPTLKALAELRGKDDVRFGVWCEVVAPGRVRVGDAVALVA